MSSVNKFGLPNLFKRPDHTPPASIRIGQIPVVEKMHQRLLPNAQRTGMTKGRDWTECRCSDTARGRTVVRQNPTSDPTSDPYPPRQNRL